MQTGTNTHTVTASDGSFDSHPSCPNDPSACMETGDRFRRAFPQAGRFTYACKIHGEPMSGTIVVE
jgi:plastocyanin